MAHMVDPGRPIHSFEISPTTFALLLENLRGIQPCIVNQLGLSDTEAEVELHYYPDSSERSSLIELPDGFRKEIQKVHVTTGDAYLRTANVAQVAFLKIDVEGHEMAVLKGFSEAIQEGRVSAVQFEHGPAHVATRHFLGDFVEFFACRGYNLYKIFPRKLEPLIYSFENSERYTGSNYVAVRSNVVF
jgi:FkbM family methyltransferase